MLAIEPWLGRNKKKILSTILWVKWLITKKLSVTNLQNVKIYSRRFENDNKAFHVRVKVSGNQSVKINMENKNEPMSMVAENFKKP